MNRFDFDRGMGIRGLTGSRPTSFQYEADPIMDAIVSRQDANNSINRATDQYEADVADFKDTIAREKEQGIAGLPSMNDLNNSPFISEGINSIIDRPNEAVSFITNPRDTYNPPVNEIVSPPFKELPPDRDSFDYGFGPGIMPPLPDDFFIEDDINTPPVLPPVFKDNPFKDIFTPPNEPPFEPPIDVPPPFTPPNEPPFTPPNEPPFVPPNEPPHWHDEERRYPPGYDDKPEDWRDEDDIYVPPPFVPPNEPPNELPIDVPPPPPPSGPINYYTGEVINNPYTPYATDSGAPALSRRISPASFGMAPGMFPPPPNNKTIEKPDELPPDRPDRNNAIFANQGKYLKNSSLNKGIMRLPQSEQGDTMTTQMFQRAFRPRR